MVQTRVVGVNRGVLVVNRNFGERYLPSVSATVTQQRISCAAPPISALVSQTSDDDVRDQAREALRNGIRRRILGNCYFLNFTFKN